MMRAAQQEREDLAAFLETLSPQQWNVPTLCTGWRVRDVVAHMICYEGMDARELLRRFIIEGRMNPGRINAIGVAEARELDPPELLARLKAHLRPRGLTTFNGGMIALLDGLIHHQDIRRPLGFPREIPAERLVLALRSMMKAPPVGAFWRARGLRLVATDIAWTRGRGPEVRGPAEAILMAAAGRPGVVGELSGPGQEKLAERIK